MSAHMEILERSVREIHDVSPDQFRNGMRLFAAGCTIIATASGNERAGLTATAVCSVSAEPPLLLVCVNKRVQAHALIERSQALSVNILGRETEGAAKVFAGMDPSIQGEERFSTGAWGVGKSGAPVLYDASTVMDCVVMRSYSEGTHSIFICRVIEVIQNDEDAPLLYYNGSFCTVNN